MAGKSPEDRQSKKISVCGGCVTILGQLPPDDPVCDSGIYCYGKKLYYRYIIYGIDYVLYESILPRLPNNMKVILFCGFALILPPITIYKTLVRTSLFLINTL